MSSPLGRVAALILALTMGLTVLVGSPATAKKPSKMNVSFGDTKFASGERYVVRGKVSGPVRRVVKLQYATKTGWRNLDSTRTKRKGKFKIKGRWDWIGKHRMRVYAPPTKSHQARFSKVRKFKVKPGYAARGSQKNFSLFKARGLTYRYNPCKAIKVRVNTDGVGDQFLPTIKQALRRVSAASGLTLRYVGKTKIRPFQTRRFKNKANLIIDFAPASEEPLFQQGAAGIGGVRLAGPARQKGGRILLIKYSGILINLDALQFYSPGFTTTDRQPLGSLFMHEIGHTVGLDHSDPGPSSPSGDQIMSPAGVNKDGAGIYEAEFGKGDLSGLRTRGLDRGCIKLPRGYQNARVPAGGDVREPDYGYTLE